MAFEWIIVINLNLKKMKKSKLYRLMTVLSAVVTVSYTHLTLPTICIV